MVDRRWKRNGGKAMRSEAGSSDPLDVIDRLDPVALRERLGANYREATAIRTLLRVAEKVRPAREDRIERKEAGCDPS
jgi:hypothetical protein